eukprot:8984083-Heterocapsa_arctica.AAC.1
MGPACPDLMALTFFSTSRSSSVTIGSCFGCSVIALIAFSSLSNFVTADSFAAREAATSSLAIVTSLRALYLFPSLFRTLRL